MGKPAKATNPMTKIDAIIAERDEEIARLRNETVELRIQNWPFVARVEVLKAELADAKQDVVTLLTAVEEQRQYIERLKTQVAELQAWKDAVPVEAIISMSYEVDRDENGMTAQEIEDVTRWILDVVKPD